MTIEHILFKDLSHIQAICEHTNANITMIPAGTEYSGFFRGVSSSCEVDKVKPKWWQCSFLHDDEYVAKEDRWMDQDVVGTMDDLVNEWNNHIRFLTDPNTGFATPVTKAHIILHFMDGSKKTIWFENDREMNEYISKTLHRENFNEILFFDGKEQTTRMAN